ncbi:hypothetical protein BDL97_15G064400 [Sphagnum fallax]|nr:hypothetical protein BDL97_15G064400 [Sphagnum fallax]
MMQSLKELETNLATYNEQLHQVRQLLEAAPGNAEYQEMASALEEVIELTYDLLKTAKQAEASNVVLLETDLDSPSLPKSQEDPPVSRFRPQQKDLSLSHDIPGRLPVGSKVQAVWSEDGEWYTATVEAVTPIGYTVTYDDWGNTEEVDLSNVRVLEVEEDDLVAEAKADLEINMDANADAMLGAEQEAEATRQAIKRKIAQAADVDVIPRGLPPKLRINPDDPEDVKAAKKKKIHSFKSKARLEQMELTQNKHQNAWQQFQTSKGKSKKVGFFTGRKRESIFKSPDDPKGKVGVTGSGKGITEFHKREKHLHLRVGGEDGDELM